MWKRQFSSSFVNPVLLCLNILRAWSKETEQTFSSLHPSIYISLYFTMSSFAHLSISKISIYLKQRSETLWLFGFVLCFVFHSLHPFDIKQNQQMTHDGRGNVPPPNSRLTQWLSADSDGENSPRKPHHHSSGSLDSPWQSPMQRPSMPELDSLVR